METVEVDCRKVCRLCGGDVNFVFNLTNLQKYDVSYFKYVSCESLQTKEPYWLEEAYKNIDSSVLDTGAAQRNIHNLAACFAISKLLRAINLVDIGGGDGLLCRLLRDYELNCFVKDKFASPTYTQGYTEPDFSEPDLVIGFEVLEHFSNPTIELEKLFNLNSKILFLSTATYSNQSKDWWYISPDSGQHVFFYSENH